MWIFQINIVTDCKPTVAHGDLRHDTDGRFPIDRVLFRAEKEIHGEITENNLKYRDNCWLPADNNMRAYFVINLGCEKMINVIQIVNTKNAQHRDRGTKSFKIFVSGPGSLTADIEVVSEVLPDPRNLHDPLPLHTFAFDQAVTTRFVKFQMNGDKHHHSGGVQYFNPTYIGMNSIYCHNPSPSPSKSKSKVQVKSPSRVQV